MLLAFILPLCTMWIIFFCLCLLFHHPLCWCRIMNFPIVQLINQYLILFYWMYSHSFPHSTLAEIWMNCLIFILMKTDGKDQHKRKYCFRSLLWLHFDFASLLMALLWIEKEARMIEACLIVPCSSNFDMQIYTCFSLSSTEGQLTATIIWYANPISHVRTS